MAGSVRSCGANGAIGSGTRDIRTPCRRGPVSGRPRPQRIPQRTGGSIVGRAPIVGRGDGWRAVEGRIGVERDVAVEVWLAGGLQAGEVVALAVHQVRRRDAAERREGVLHASGEALLPFAHQLLDLAPLQVLLR